MQVSKKILVVIPTLNPNEYLVDYVKDLAKFGFDVLVVNDSSHKSYDHIFYSLSLINSCTIFKHAKNMGKGRALKNAFNLFLTSDKYRDYIGVITADSDGQHTIDDVIKASVALKKHPNALILGCRNFDSRNVPYKSEFGNKITRIVLRLLYGKKITDTQTGLRAFPREILPDMLDIKGERFEYESKMLIHAFENHMRIKEIPIETVYYEENSGTHFNPIKDSIKIYSIIFSSFIKYVFASFSSFLIDILAFNLLFSLIIFFGLSKGYLLILLATSFARIVSSIYNYWINKSYVFANNSPNNKTIRKYYLLVISKVLLSSLLVYLIWNYTQFKESSIKVVVDTLLFFLSYRLQMSWVFRKNKNKG